MTDALLRLAEILTAWPVILLVLPVGFRKPIGAFLSEYVPRLIERLRSAEVAGSRFEFIPEELSNLRSVPVQHEEPEALVESPPEQPSEEQDLATPEERMQEPIDIREDRRRLSEEFRKLFMVHVLTPSDIPGQKYDIFIYVKRHHNEEISDVVEAEFFFGRSWGNRIFEGSREGNRIGVRTSAYGEFSCVCRVTFEDKRKMLLYRYIDFEMGNAIAELMQQVPAEVSRKIS